MIEPTNYPKTSVPNDYWRVSTEKNWRGYRFIIRGRGIGNYSECPRGWRRYKTEVEALAAAERWCRRHEPGERSDYMVRTEAP